MIRWSAVALISALLLPPSSPAEAVLRTVPLRTAAGEFRLAAGDAEFAGHGPSVTLSVALRVSTDGRSLLADLKGTAQEVGGTTRAVIAETGVVVYTAEWGAVIRAIAGPTSAVLGYRDTDHEADYVCELAGEVPIEDRVVSFRNILGVGCAAGLVRTARFVGDTDGPDVNTGAANSKLTRTSVEVLFAPVVVDVTPAASLAYLQAPVSLAVPYAGYPQENFTGNNCGSSAGFRTLRFYGSPITYEQMVDRVRSRFHTANLVSLGIPPGLLKDALNEVSPGFSVVSWSYPADGENVAANMAIRADLRSRLVGVLRQGKPMIALLGWGSQTAYRGTDAYGRTVYHGLYSPVRDDAQIDLLHYVVIRGYDPVLDTFDVVDNGMGKSWRADFLLNLMLFDRGPDFQIAINSVAPDVRPATVIYKR